MPRTILTDKVVERICIDEPMSGISKRLIPKNASRKLRRTLSKMPVTEGTLMTKANALANLVCPGNGAFLEALLVSEPNTTILFINKLIFLSNLMNPKELKR